MEFLTVTREGNAAFVKMERPPANALSSQVIKELDYLLGELEANESIRAILLYGEGRFFLPELILKSLLRFKAERNSLNWRPVAKECLRKSKAFQNLLLPPSMGQRWEEGLNLQWHAISGLSAKMPKWAFRSFSLD